MWGLAKSRAAIPDSQLDRHTDYLVCRNGVLHIPTRTLAPHRKELYCTTGVDFDYDPSARAQAWDYYLEWFIRRYGGGGEARTDGTPYDADHLRRVVLYPAMDRCGISREKWSHGFHIFRHTAGSIVHAQTGDLKLAQELLGHSCISTTSAIYIHMPENVVAKATEILAREITGVLGSEKMQ